MSLRTVSGLSDLSLVPSASVGVGKALRSATMVAALLSGSLAAQEVAQQEPKSGGGGSGETPVVVPDVGGDVFPERVIALFGGGGGSVQAVPADKVEAVPDESLTELLASLFTTGAKPPVQEMPAEERRRLTAAILQRQREIDQAGRQIAEQDVKIAALAAEMAAAEKRVAELKEKLSNAPIDTVSGTFVMGGRSFPISVRFKPGTSLDDAKAMLNAAVKASAAKTTVVTWSIPGRAKEASCQLYVWKDPNGNGKPYARAWGGATGWGELFTVLPADCVDQAAVDAVGRELQAKMVALDQQESWESFSTGGAIKFRVRPEREGSTWPKTVCARYTVCDGMTEFFLSAEGVAQYEDAVAADQAGATGSLTVEGMKESLRATAASFPKARGQDYAGAKYDLYSNGSVWWARYRLPNAGTGAWSYVQPRADRASCEAAVKAAVDGVGSPQGAPTKK